MKAPHAAGRENLGLLAVESCDVLGLQTVELMVTEGGNDGLVDLLLIASERRWSNS